MEHVYLGAMLPKGLKWDKHAHGSSRKNNGMNCVCVCFFHKRNKVDLNQELRQEAIPNHKPSTAEFPRRNLVHSIIDQSTLVGYFKDAVLDDFSELLLIESFGLGSCPMLLHV